LAHYSTIDEKSENFDVGNLIATRDKVISDKKKLAVLVAFRDCYEELEIFAPHMKKFLNAQKIPYHIFVINQLNRILRFNKATLFNVGYLYTKSKFDYIALHDIDLLPLNQNLSYDYPTNGVLHMAPAELLPAHNKSLVGGILLLTNEDYEKTDGMSNLFWGWGLEDDELYVNLRTNNIKINRPEGITTGKNGTFWDIHSNHRTRDKIKCFEQDVQLPVRSPNAGLKSTKYGIKRVEDYKFNEATVTIIDVDVECDRKITPWCECRNEP